MSNTGQTELSGALQALRPYVRKVFGWSLATAVLSLAPAVYMLEVYGRAVNSRNLNTLAMLTLLVIGAYVMLVMLDEVRTSVLQAASRRLDEILSVRVFDAVFAAQSTIKGTGDGQPQADLRKLREFVTSPAAQAFLELPGALVFLACVFLIRPSLGLAALAGAIVQFLLAAWTEQRTLPVVTQANQARTHADDYVRSALQNSQVIDSMGMLGRLQERWMLRHRKHLALQARAAYHAGLATTLSRSIQVLQGSAILGLGCLLHLNGYLPEGGAAMIVASILGGKAIAPLVKAVAQWKLVVQARDARQRLEALLARFPARPTQMALPAPSGTLTVAGLTIKVQGAGNRRPVLSNVSFKVQAGGVLAVIGSSGAGKTTLMRALLGLVPAASGKVRLDGIDVHARDKELLGEHLGYLPQEIALFDGTLAENIARFGPADPQRLERACQDAQLDALVRGLPQGLNTPVGPGGAFLSGGQRQRVGLARALYGSPALVVLDEPLSNMDQEGEGVVMEAVRNLKARGTTVVFVTHTPSLLAVADRVLALRNGAVQVFGSSDEVIAHLTHVPGAGPAVQLAGSPA